MKNSIRLLLAALLLPATAHAISDEERNARINAMLEDNASSAAYARMCEDEPTAEQLKTTTMLLLAVTGYPAHTVQLGSAKFNDVMRREVAGFRSRKEIDCEERVREARARLADTQAIIRSSRRDEVPAH